MKVVSVERLEEFYRKHADAQTPLTAWFESVRSASWRNIIDVRVVFPHADAVRVSSGRTITVFNVRGRRYRLLTAIDYPLQAVAVLAVLTHAEYYKEKWKRTL